MALYNEVQKYYDNGLQVPEDVTLLFSDDNFGSIRRLPNEEEKKRPGGSGVCRMSGWERPLLMPGSIIIISSILDTPDATDG